MTSSLGKRELGFAQRAQRESAPRQGSAKMIHTHVLPQTKAPYLAPLGNCFTGRGWRVTNRFECA